MKDNVIMGFINMHNLKKVLLVASNDNVLEVAEMVLTTWWIIMVGQNSFGLA